VARFSRHLRSWIFADGTRVPEDSIVVYGLRGAIEVARMPRALVDRAIRLGIDPRELKIMDAAADEALSRRRERDRAAAELIAACADVIAAQQHDILPS
jgi:hypothetical protein